MDESSYSFGSQHGHSISHSENSHAEQEQDEFERILVELESHGFGK